MGEPVDMGTGETLEGGQMFKAAIKSPESVGVGVEVVTRQEFERRKESIENSGASAAIGGLSDTKGIY